MGEKKNKAFFISQSCAADSLVLLKSLFQDVSTVLLDSLLLPKLRIPGELQSEVKI